MRPVKPKVKSPDQARLLTPIPVELKRKIAAYANLRGYGIKNANIEMAAAHLDPFSPEEQELIDTILDHP